MGIVIHAEEIDLAGAQLHSVEPWEVRLNEYGELSCGGLSKEMWVLLHAPVVRGSAFLLTCSLQSYFTLHIGVIPCSLAERVSNLTQYNDFSLIFFFEP